MAPLRVRLAIALGAGTVLAASCAPVGEYGEVPTEDVCRTHWVGLRGAKPPTQSRPATVRPPPVSAPGGVFRLVDPPGPTSFSRESYHVVAWVAGRAPPGAKVRIEESGDGGASFTEIETADADQGRVVWTVPAAGADRRVLRVVPSWDARAARTVDVQLTPSQKASFTWACITDKTPFHARTGAGALVHRDRMWLLGGSTPDEFFPRGTTGNDVWSSADGRDWRQEKAQSFVDGEFDDRNDWEGRHDAGYAVFDDKMWIVGGDALQHHYQPDVWSSADGRSWTRVADKTPWGERTLHHTLAFDGRLWVLGGQTTTDLVPDDGASQTAFNDVWSSKDGLGWTKVATRGPMWQPRGAMMQGAVHAGRMWIVGGGVDESVSASLPDGLFFTDVWSSANGIEWTQEAVTTPFTPRHHQSVVAWDGRLWVIGGDSGEGRADGAWYSTDGRNWYPTTTPWEGRRSASVWVYADAIWMAGGGSTDVWRLERSR